MTRKFTRVNRKRKLQATRKRQKGGSQSLLFNDAYVISTDKNSDRYTDIKRDANEAGLIIKHWNATVLQKDNGLFHKLPYKGIGKAIFSEYKNNNLTNLGQIGCFLSHRELLTHIASKNSVELGTLILEDDVKIPYDLFKKLEAIESSIPGDWDILFLDKRGTTKSEKSINKNIVKILQTRDPNTNWGTHSYIVKNSSIKNRILPFLEQMVDYIDNQYTIYADKINEYIAYGIIPLNMKHSVQSIIKRIDDQRGGSVKKILILMSDNRPLGKDYNALTACINYEYSRKHGYDFIYYRPYLKNSSSNELNNCLDAKGNERHASWSKLLSSKKALELNYDYIVYIDSDCIFKDFTRRIEEYIQPFSGKDILFLNDKPWNTSYPCAGFYICKVNLESKRLMNDWYSIDMPENNIKHPWEQAALVKLYKGYNIQIIDDWMFQEKEGQYLRHIASYEKEKRLPYFNNFIKTININPDTILPKIKIVEYDTNNL